MKTIEECDCMCHDERTQAIHFMACCDTCPVCEKNIKFEYMKEHLNEHKKTGSLVVVEDIDAYLLTHSEEELLSVLDGEKSLITGIQND